MRLGDGDIGNKKGKEKCTKKKKNQGCKWRVAAMVMHKILGINTQLKSTVDKPA